MNSKIQGTSARFREQSAVRLRGMSKNSLRFGQDRSYSIPVSYPARTLGCLKLCYKVLKKIQRRDGRRSMSGGVLFLYVDAKSVERNEPYEAFSAALFRVQNRAARDPPLWRDLPPEA